jgi:hypothetical protein
MVKLLPLLLVAVFSLLLSASDGLRADDPGKDPFPGLSTTFDPLLLNIRMSARPLRPPPETIKQSWTLEGYRLGQLGAQAPRAAIIDDEARRRFLILSASEDGSVEVYRVSDMPIDVAPLLRPAADRARARQCQNRRMDPAGELGCLALCLLESLKE